LAVYYFFFSMIPTFRQVVKREHHIYRDADIGDILDYVHQPDLERGAIAKIPRDPGIPGPTFRDWHRRKIAGENWFPLAEGHSRLQVLNPE
jgi:hypothetical protein